MISLLEYTYYTLVVIPLQLCVHIHGCNLTFTRVGKAVKFALACVNSRTMQCHVEVIN